MNTSLIFQAKVLIILTCKIDKNSSETRSTRTAILFIKTPLNDCCFVSLMWFILYDLQMSIIKHFFCGLNQM